MSTKNGGDGAVRELADLILQGKEVRSEALKNIYHTKKNEMRSFFLKEK